MKITSLEPGHGGKQITVHFGTSRRIMLDSETVVKAGLKVGQELDAGAVNRLRETARRHNALETALRYLEYRPRSEKEVRDRLRRGGYSGSIIDHVISQLRGRKLINDRTFAEFWREGRVSSGPRSRRTVRSELLARGVNHETAESVTAGIDDETAAYELGLKKARSLTGLEHDDFRKKLGGYLQRRGFDYDVIARMVKRLWRERQP